MVVFFFNHEYKAYTKKKSLTLKMHILAAIMTNCCEATIDNQVATQHSQVQNNMYVPVVNLAWTMYPVCTRCAQYMPGNTRCIIGKYLKGTRHIPCMYQEWKYHALFYILLPTCSHSLVQQKQTVRKPLVQKILTVYTITLWLKPK